MRIRLKNILCTTDFSEVSNNTIPYGIAMAKEFNAKLSICHILEIPRSGLYTEAQIDPTELKSRFTAYVQDQCKRLMEDQGVKWRPVIGTGHVPDEIRRLSKTHDIDLVITATHGRSGIKRFILGSVTERLIRTLSCPILVVVAPENRAQSSRDSKFSLERIMVGCDFSSDSDLAFRYALSFAQEFQASLHLVHVTPPSTATLRKRPARSGHSQKNMGGQRRIRDRLMSMVPEEAMHWCTPVTTVLEGRPYAELARYAMLYDIEMMFLGIRGHGLIETHLVGSTTDRVVRQMPCPVLAARPTASQASAQTATTVRTARETTGLEGDFDLFSAERQRASVRIRLKENFMRRATDLPARDAFLAFLDRVHADNSIKTLIMVGAPGKTGSAEYFEFYERFLTTESDLLAIHRLFNVVDQILLSLVNLNKIVIHTDCGIVLPLYFNLSLACDYRIVGQQTVFQNPYLEMGMIPKGGGPFFLMEMLGRQKAYEILLSEEAFTADDALRLGLVDRVVPEAELLSAADMVAENFERKPGTSLRGIKRLLNHSRRGIKGYLEAENQELLSIAATSKNHLQRIKPAGKFSDH